MKAVFQKLGAVAWGNSVYDLLRTLSKKVSVPESVLNCGRALDRFYILARYPNGFDEGSPFEYFTEEDARKMPSFIVKESLNSVRVFWLKRKELIEELRRKAQELGRKDERVLKVVLFGSLAENRAIPGSDADVLILLKTHEKSFAERVEEYLKAFDIDFPVEVFPYTANERSPIVEQALKKGIILFER